MRMGAVALLSLAAGCAGYGRAGDYRWSLQVPDSVDRGADFEFRVRTFGPEDVEVSGVPYRFSVAWPGGPSDALPRAGRSGDEPKRARSRLVAGPASILVHAQDVDDKWVKVAEAAFSVK